MATAKKAKQKLNYRLTGDYAEQTIIPTTIGNEVYAPVRYKGNAITKCNKPHRWFLDLDITIKNSLTQKTIATTLLTDSKCLLTDMSKIVGNEVNRIIADHTQTAILATPDLSSDEDYSALQYNLVKIEAIYTIVK